MRDAFEQSALTPLQVSLWGMRFHPDFWGLPRNACNVFDFKIKYAELHRRSKSFIFRFLYLREVEELRNKCIPKLLCCVTACLWHFKQNLSTFCRGTCSLVCYTQFLGSTVALRTLSALRPHFVVVFLAPNLFAFGGYSLLRGPLLRAFFCDQNAVQSRNKAVRPFRTFACWGFLPSPAHLLLFWFRRCFGAAVMGLRFDEAEGRNMLAGFAEQLPLWDCFAVSILSPDSRSKIWTVR